MRPLGPGCPPTRRLPQARSAGRCREGRAAGHVKGVQQNHTSRHGFAMLPVLVHGGIFREPHPGIATKSGLGRKRGLNLAWAGSRFANSYWEANQRDVCRQGDWAVAGLRGAQAAAPAPAPPLAPTPPSPPPASRRNPPPRAFPSCRPHPMSR